MDGISYRIGGFEHAANMQRWKDGVIWSEELGRYVSTDIRGSGLADSMQDMLVNIVGAVVVCVAALIGLRFRPDWFEGKLLMSYKKFRNISAKMSSGWMKRSLRRRTDVWSGKKTGGCAGSAAA